MPSIWRDKPFSKTTDDPDNLLEPTFQPAFQAWKDSPGAETSSTLLKAVDPVLTEALRTYGGSSANSPTLKSKAKLMALQALKKYDPSRARLRTHLLSQLQSLRRQAAHSEALVHIPEGAALAWNKLRLETDRLTDEMGRDPSTSELSRATGLSMQRIAKLRAHAAPSVTESQVQRIDPEGAGVWLPPVRSGPVSSSAQEMWMNVVYHESDPVDQLILEHTTGLHGKPVLANKDIARRARLSPGAVSQRRLRLQKKLDLAGEVGLLSG